MAKTAVIEKLNRKALDGKKSTKIQAKVITKEKAPAPKAAPAKGPSLDTLAHRRLLVVLGAIDKYGSVQEKTKAAADLTPVAVRLIVANEKMGEKEVSEYLSNPPSRFLPLGYKNLGEHGTSVKDALH